VHELEKKEGIFEGIFKPKGKIMTADLARLEQCWAISREELKPICHEGKTQPRH
jgi:hypothetical protein